MNDVNTFDRDVLERLTKIETKIEMLLSVCPANQAHLHDAEISLQKVDQSVKYAHHRIDGMYKTASAIGVTVSLLINFLAYLTRI